MLQRLSSAVFLLFLVTPLRADQVVVPSQNYAGATILGLHEGRLRFRVNGEQVVEVPLGTVQTVVVDRAPFADDFNEAETLLAKGEAEKAAGRYERALRLSADFWSDVVVARLVAAHDRAGHLDEAADYFVRLATSEFAGAQTAAHLFPTNTPPARNTRYTRAIHVLDSALGMKLTDGQRLVIELLRYELFRRLGDQRAGEAAGRIAALALPEYVASGAACEILSSALRTAMLGASGSAGFATLDQAIDRCPEDRLAVLLLVKGDVLLARARTREEIIRASWPYLRVAIHMPDDPRAPEALLRTAEAVGRIGNKERAAKLLAECAAHPQATEEIKRKAQEAAARIGGPAKEQ